MLTLLGTNMLIAEGEWITKKNPGPALIIEEEIEVYTYTNIHTIVLEIDLKTISEDFKTIKEIIEEGTTSLNLNLQDEEKKNPTIEAHHQNRTIKIKPESHASKILKSTTGKVKIQLATALKQLEELQEDYQEWLAINFIGEKVDITENEEGETGEYYAIRSELHNHITQEMEELPSKTNKRKKRGMMEVNNAISTLGKIYRQYGLEKAEEGYNLKSTNRGNIFEITSLIANRLNGTLRYLRKSSALKFRLMMAVYKTSEGMIINEGNMEDIQLVQEYILSLVKLNYVLDEMQKHFRELKEALQGEGNKLSSFLLSPKELNEYINKLTEFSGYTPVIKFQEMAAVYYNLINTKIEKEGDYLKLSIPIPITNKEQETSWKKIEVKLTPFLHNGTIYKIMDKIESKIIYNTNSYNYFKEENCKRKENILLCKPEYFEYSECTENILKEDNWEEICTLLEDTGEIFEKLGKNTYIYAGLEETQVNCSCLKEEAEQGRMRVVKEEITDVIDKINILEISNWCSCQIGNINIPRRMEQVSNKNKIIHIQNTIESNFTWDFMDTKSYHNFGLLNEIHQIRKGFMMARRNEETTKTLKEKQNIIIKSTAGTAAMMMMATGILGILIIMGKCKKSKRETKITVKKDILLMSVE